MSNSDSAARLDPRAQRTRERLQRAALELLGTRAPGSISVTEVVEQAEVNRSSFYAHYTHLHALFADALESVAIQTGTQGGHSAGAASSATEAELPEAVGAYMAHIEQYADAYRWALGPTGSPEIVNRLRERFRISLSIGFEHHLKSVPGADLGFAAQASFLAGGMIGFIWAWLSSPEPVASNEAAAWLWREVRSEFADAVCRATGGDLHQVERERAERAAAELGTAQG